MSTNLVVFAREINDEGRYVGQCRFGRLIPRRWIPWIERRSIWVLLQIGFI